MIQNLLKHVFLLILMLTGNYMLSYAQDQNSLNLSPIPHSPTVASLGKYIDFPVSLYTGQANVNIPIYELSVGDISLPISLSYHTGGIRVEEIAPWVGLGWSLNAGSVVTRSINGAPDGSVSFDYEQPPHIMNVESYQRYYENSTNVSDSQHDYFHFNVNGYSGKFVIDFENDAQPVLIPQQKVIIEKEGTWNSVDALTKKIYIITPDGLKYTFGANDDRESNEAITICNGGGANSETRITSWFLSRIESPSSGHYIEFEYESKRLEYETRGAETKYEPYGDGGTKVDDECMIENRINTLRLKSITTSNGYSVKFNQGVERCDLDEDKVLDEIVVLGADNIPVKKFKFNYKYLASDGELEELSTYDPATQDNVLDIRLMLTSLQEQGYDRTTSTFTSNKSPFQFEYNRDIGLPSRFSNSQDAWGYYNGKNNTTLVPATFWGTKYLEGANRIPDLDFAKQGALSSITFPTGGTTSYEYGLNECVNHSFRYYAKSSVSEIVHDIGRDDLNETEVIFEIDKTRIVDVIFETVTSTTICPDYLPCNVILKLYSLNPDETINELLFNSENYINEEEDDSFISVSQEKTLPSGKYKLVQTINDMTWAEGQDDFDLRVRWYEQPDNPTYDVNTASGLRIKKNITYDPASDQTLAKSFVYEQGYLNNYSKFERVSVHPTNNCLQYNTFTLFQRSSVSHEPLTFTSGGIVGYGKVTVIEGNYDDESENPIYENGHTVYNYYTSREYPDLVIVMPYIETHEPIPLGDIQSFNEDQWEYPYSLLDSKDWKRGLLKNVTVHDADGDPLKFTEYLYKFYDDETQPYYDPSRVKNLFGAKVGNEQVDNVCGDPQGYLNINFYRLQSSWYEKVGEKQVLYDKNGNSFVNTISYEYANTNHFQLTKKTITDSESRERVNKYWYSLDYADNTLGSNLLRAEHMYNQVLEQVTEVEGIERARTILLYSDESGNVLPKEQTIYPNGISNGNAKKVNFQYDAIGNIVQIQRDGDLPTSYLWGYNHSLPIAQVVGTSYNEIDNSLLEADKVALQSLDEDALHTKLNGVRIFFDDAQITSYSYDPLIGMTSTLDPNNIKTYYEYDDYNRLYLIRDQEKNIVKKFSYYYGSSREAEPENGVPTITTISDQTDDEGEVISLQIAANDPDEDDLTYQATNLPPGLQINASTGLISGTIASGANANSPYSADISVNDGNEGTATETFTWTVNAPNTPSFTLTFVNAEGLPISGDNAITDMDCDQVDAQIVVNASGGTAPYTYIANLSPHPYQVSKSLEAWDGNSFTMRLNRTAPDAASTIYIEMTVTDANQNPVTETVTFTVPWNQWSGVSCP